MLSTQRTLTLVQLVRDEAVNNIYELPKIFAPGEIRYDSFIVQKIERIEIIADDVNVIFTNAQ